ncbi:MAG: nuclear transport factor 2 family protein [Candidatus Obscuribacterales bacterium]|nr:nuclear transport factor 2 family protein [Candidatus Obscuribacterales bacterium]
MQALSSSSKATNLGLKKSTLKTVAPLMVALSMTLIPALQAFALETSPAITTTANAGDLFFDSDKSHEAERKEVETLLSDIEAQWNAHNLEKVMGCYAEEYINNDGLDKKAVSELTQEFWKTYPDAKSSSRTKQIRIEGNFATVESRDTAVGTTANNPIHDNSLSGELSSVSEGQLYLKKTGTEWKIIGDRIDYEKVRVAYGVAKSLNVSFTAPEQVKSGKQYSARIDVDLPNGFLAVGSITNQPLEYPQHTPNELWRAMEPPSSLERLIAANTNNKNELLMATIGITDIASRKLVGIELLTRRMNVVPEVDPTKIQAATALFGAPKEIKLKSEKKEQKD